MPWISNEAKALKTKLSGLTITDAASPNGRDVNVWFRRPEYELRALTFPCIILEHTRVDKAEDREHRGTTLLPYSPEGYPSVVPTEDASGNTVNWDTTVDFDPSESPFKVQDYPVPYNVDFTVTAYSRFQQELNVLVANLSQIDRLPNRFGYLEVPEDGTIRTLDVLGGPELVNETDGDGKRLFSAVYSVRTVSELNLYGVQQMSEFVNSVSLDIKQITSTS